MFHKILQIALAFYCWNTVLCCQDNCVSCRVNTQECEQCKDGYWLQGNVCRRCPDNCEQCINNLYCTSCKAEFYALGTCASRCPESCDTSGCKDIGYCYRCPYGYYGPYCQYSCDLCRNGSCSLRQCTNGCTDGYTEEYGHCVKCQPNCTLCERQGYCLECNKGFYHFSYTSDHGSKLSLCFSCLSGCEECNSGFSCIKCQPGKYGQTCEYTCSESYCHMCIETEGGDKCIECIARYRLNGTLCVPENVCSQNCVNGCSKNRECTGGCKAGWTGKTCSIQCEAQCQRCDQSDWRVCTLCKGDSYTISCNVDCSSECSRISGRQTCGLNDGYCLIGCINGYWGSYCSKECHEGCNSVRCSQADGYCERCHRNYYGAGCQRKCSENCRDSSSNDNICRMCDGKCEFGCVEGYSGDNCDVTASQKMPISVTGKDGLTTAEAGERSSVPYSGEPDGRNNGQSGTVMFFLGMVTGLGICLVVAVGTGIVCFRKRKKRRQKKMTEAKSMSGGERRVYVNTAFGTCMGVTPSTSTVDKHELRDIDQTQAPVSVYERLEDRTLGEQNQYSELVGPTGGQGTHEGLP